MKWDEVYPNWWWRCRGVEVAERVVVATKVVVEAEMEGAKVGVAEVVMAVAAEVVVVSTEVIAWRWL